MRTRAAQQAKARKETTPVQSAPRRTPAKAAVECVRYGAPPPPERSPTQTDVGMPFHRVKVNRLNRRETFHVGITELEHFLIIPGDEAISIFSFAEDACDEDGRKKFAVVETMRGVEVAQTGRFFEALHKNRTGSRRVLDREAKQDVGDMERKQHLTSGASEEIWKRVLQGVMVLEPISRRWKVSFTMQGKK